jgi:inosine-uridine nucleoside N-ribohydrolase
MTAPAVILDCDPGHDDYFAILLAQRFTALRGITTLAGNTSVQNATRNACIAADICGFTGPIVAGSAAPLVGQPRYAEHIHGASGLDGPALPETTRPATEGDATSFLLAEAGPDTWIVATGPLTNVALALRRDPGLAARVAGISIMGGSASFGNVTPTAEFNIWHDPEAASIVFSSGATMRMLGLNVTHTVLVDRGYIDRIAALGSAAARFSSELLGAYLNSYDQISSKQGSAPLHDPCALLAVSHPGVFGFVPMHVEVELAGTLTRGTTVVDQRELADTGPANAQVAVTADGPVVLELLYETISRL